MIKLNSISKIYKTAEGDVKALDDVSLHIQEGKFIAIKGPSGCGKSTLLMTIGTMLRPTSGKLFLNSKDVYSMNPVSVAKFRRRNIGFVFQMFHLLPYLNVRDNVLLADSSGNKKAALNNTDALLEKLGMKERLSHRPLELSTGEKQRCAIARALINGPKILLADEPTGNLDPENAKAVYEYISQFHRSGGTVVLVTHRSETEPFADETIYMRNGCIENSRATGL